MTIFVILGIVIMLAVLGATLITISKGYAYEHKIDPLPEENKENVSKASSDR